MDKKTTNRLKRYARVIERRAYIDPQFYEDHKIKRGLRNKNGTGVLVGVTGVADVVGYAYEDGKKIPTPGRLDYRGYSVEEILKGARERQSHAFEEVSYLLLFGQLPTQEDLDLYHETLWSLTALPGGYLEDVILKTANKNLMNKIMQSVLSLYSYDPDPDNTEIFNVLNQSLGLIAKMPMILAYCYAAKRHYVDDASLIIHRPKSNYDPAENLLHMIRPDSSFTEEEAQILDTLMVLHAEHGGGNNSAFATHVVSSSGTDSYSAITTALGSLKGPRHGGANLMVDSMVADLKDKASDWTKAGQVKKYLEAVLDKKAFDRSGLIYGLGHAVYTLSDPRALLLKERARTLAQSKNCPEEYQLIENIEKIGGDLIAEKFALPHPAPANVDLYSGLIFHLLGIPRDLFTPIFALSRTTGWCAHRLEQVLDKKIMRPAYLTLNQPQKYLPMEDR
ncbi:2-methylcitrate synthase 1 [Urinicoccus massiliensis]|uniref:citrate synthase (unknown stereospecificity) n=1 Tax=Urinicoccus massiliensis TaxID=1723382 RepID=A0A8H2M944_9FIRM|nr:citrate synthase [Urinicoccus massiliensis]VFB16971.1 2-methylcitrate synthase 1 [Urinicoccus massiliensis]